MFEQENIDTQRIVVIGIFGAIVAFVLIIGVQVLYYRMEKADEFTKFVDVKPAERVAYQAEQRGKITEYKYVDRATDRVKIPIDRAMDLELRALQPVNGGP